MDKFPADRASGFDSSKAPLLTPALKDDAKRISDHFAAKLGTLLKDTLARDFCVSSHAMESGLYAELCSRLPIHTVAAEIHMAPLSSSALIFIEPALAFPLVELCAGGSLFLPQPIGPTSDLDRILLEAVTIHMLIALRDSWQGLCVLAPRLESLESDLRCIKAFKGQDPVLLSTFELEVMGVRGLLHLCLPFDALVPGAVDGENPPPQDPRVETLVKTVESLESRIRELDRTLEEAMALSSVETVPPAASLEPEKTCTEYVNSIMADPVVAARTLPAFLASSENGLAGLALMALGKENAVTLFKLISKDDIDALCFDMARVEQPADRGMVEALARLSAYVKAASEHRLDGIDFVRDVLEEAFGAQEAVAVINRLTDSLSVRPFDFIRQVDPVHVFRVIGDSHPQIATMVLSLLEPSRAAILLALFPEELQIELSRRVVALKAVSPMFIREVERGIEKRLTLLSERDSYCVFNGPMTAVDMLSYLDSDSERVLMEKLEHCDSDTARVIKEGLSRFEVSSPRQQETGH